MIRHSIRPRLFQRLARGGHVRGLALAHVALGHDPAAGATRRHQQDFGRRSQAISPGAIRQGSNLLDGKFP